MSPVKRSLFASTMLIVVAAGASAAAQTRAAASASAASADAGSTEIVVTGSRIPRPNLDQPVPVSQVTTFQIENAGTSNLGDIIARLPALGSDAGVRANANIGGQGAGLNEADLRNLGADRTLTLVDGIRHVGGDAGSVAVDLNSIPPALVDHVEVITGGASAIYGSDAVSGVVNIITKKTFVGVEASAQYGGPTAGNFGQNYSAYLTVGRNFASDRGNAALTFFYDRTEQVLPSNISGFKNYGSIVNPADCADNTVPCDTPITGDGIPDHLTVPYVESEFIGPSTVLLDANSFAPLFTFTKTGQPIAQQQRIGYNSFAFGSFAGPCATCFALEDYIKLQPPIDRKGADFRVRFEVTPAVNFSLDAKYVRSDIQDEFQPSFTFGDFQLQPDNAFLTPAIRAQLAANGVNLSDGSTFPFISRFLTDLGDRGETTTRETYRFVAGFDGKFANSIADLNWNLTANYGVTSNHFIDNNLRLTGNYEAAQDAVIDPATGQAACRVNVPSAQGAGYTPPANMYGPASACVPYNVFGTQNSAAALNYIRYNAHEHHQISQGTLDLNFTFDSSHIFKLQGGPIAFAGGYEYRKEESENINDPVEIANFTDNAASPDQGGHFSVHEVFIEANAPILKDLPFAEELSLDGATREAHYSSAGWVNAYKVGGIYAPIKDLKVRATYDRAVRAPNIIEAYSGLSPSFFNIIDPCDVQNINLNANRAANCAAAGVPANFNSNTNASILGESGGNPQLKPESSTSYTIGFVLQPSVIPGLAFTADYFSIKITNAITQPAAQDILNNCYDSPNGLDQTFCSLLTRGVDSNINFVKSIYINASSEQTHGIDFQIDYSHRVDSLTQRWSRTAFLNGVFSTSMDVTWLMALRQAPFQTDPGVYHIFEGTVGAPTIKGTLNLGYTQGPLTVGWASHFLSRVATYNLDPQSTVHSEGISPDFIRPYIYHDVSARYRFGNGVELFGGVNNLFDERYPAGLFGGGSIGNGDITNGASEASYDLVGRFLFIGVKFRR